jgi:hypothetical protein
MADHIVSLSVVREAALQKILDSRNLVAAQMGMPLLTKDDLIREWALSPIKERIRDDRAALMERRQTALEAATPEVQLQIDQLLGLA